VKGERGTRQDSERKLANKGHSPPIERKARGWIRTAKPASEEHSQTVERGAKGELGAKESQPVRDTHLLLRAEQGTGQNSKTKPASEGHSRPVKHRTKGESGQQRKVSEQGTLTGCRVQREEQVRSAKGS
jgi:hypothetical protein